MEPAREDLERLRELNAEISDLGRARALLFWDERTQMPPAGQAGRAEQLATLVRVRHRIQASDELAALLERLEAAELADPIAAATVRMAARDAAKARLVPAELRAEMARAASDGERAWREARELGDATPFLPALARNIELRRRYIECFDDVEHPGMKHESLPDGKPFVQHVDAQKARLEFTHEPGQRQRAFRFVAVDGGEDADPQRVPTALRPEIHVARQAVVPARAPESSERTAQEVRRLFRQFIQRREELLDRPPVAGRRRRMFQCG